MTAEKYLERVKKIDALILNKKREHRRWVDAAEGLGGVASGDRVQTTRNLHRGADAIGKYIDLESEIKALEAEKQNIIRTLESLPSVEYDILHKLFVGKYDKKLDSMQYYSLKDIAYQYKKSYDWAKKKKRHALRLLQTLLDGSNPPCEGV